MDIFGNTDPHKMPKHLFSGAISIKYHSAERADTGKQNFTVCPRHWYIDATFRCEACRKEFLFSAKEQRFWYEDRRFYVDSQPKRCPACRKNDRRIKLLKQQYDSLVSGAISSDDISTKKMIIGILDELGSASFSFPKKMTEHRELLLKQINEQSKPLGASGG